MNIKITGSSGPHQTEKSKKGQKASTADKAKFGSLLDALMGPEGAQQADAVEASALHAHGGGGHSYVPQDAAERSAWMLDKLEKLYADILSGTPTAAAEELRQALETAVKNRSQLPDHLRQLVNEIDVRSAVEIAKLEAAAHQED